MPAGHWVHSDEPDFEKDPLGQEILEVLLSFGKVPPGQISQVIAPLKLEKVPSGYFKHSDASSFG